MKPTDDAVWQDWGATWRTSEQRVVTLAEMMRQSVDRQSFALRLVVMSEIFVTLASLGVAWWVLGGERQVARTGWVVAVVLHTAAVWVFVIWNRRGIWKPLGESTVAYLALAKERARRRRQAANFVFGLIVVELSALAVWLSTRLIQEGAGQTSQSAPRDPIALVPATAVSAVAVWWAFRERSRAARELARLEVVDRQLSGEGVAS